MFMKFLRVVGLDKIDFLGLIHIRIWIQDQFSHFFTIDRALDNTLNRINSKSRVWMSMKFLGGIKEYVHARQWWNRGSRPMYRLDSGGCSEWERLVRSTWWRQKMGNHISLQIFWKFHNRIAWKLVNFSEIIIICWIQSLTFCLKISSRCGAT